MKKTDIFLLCVFTTCFFMCSVIMGGNYFYIKIDNGTTDNYLEETDFTIVAESKEPPSDLEEPIKETPPVQASEPVTEDEPVTEPEETDFFANTLFIGDSRTVGLMEYGNITSADFFADSGMNVFTLGRKKLSFADKKDISFEEMLSSKEYSKIYLMLGINELGYEFHRLEAKYKDVLHYIMSVQPTATVYVCANMHVTKAQSDKDNIYNNTNIDRVNQMIADLANEKTIIYLDVNELFDDSEGNLAKEYSSDAFHVFGKHYTEWTEWLEEASE